MITIGGFTFRNCLVPFDGLLSMKLIGLRPEVQWIWVCVHNYVMLPKGTNIILKISKILLKNNFNCMKVQFVNSGFKWLILVYAEPTVLFRLNLTGLVARRFRYLYSLVSKHSMILVVQTEIFSKN